MPILWTWDRMFVTQGPFEDKEMFVIENANSSYLLYDFDFVVVSTACCGEGM